MPGGAALTEGGTGGGGTGEPSSSVTKVVKRSLFAVGNIYPQKKVMTFNKHTNDFTFSVNYGTNDHLPRNELRMAGIQNHSSVQVEGVTTAFQKHINDGAEPKGIKVNECSGIYRLLRDDCIGLDHFIDEL